METCLSDCTLSMSDCTIPSVFSDFIYIYDLRDGLEWGRFSKADKATDLGGRGKELGEDNLRF